MSAWTPARRKAMSEMQKSRMAAVKASTATNGNGSHPLNVSAQIILSIHGQNLTLTSAEAADLHRALAPFIDTPAPSTEANG